MNFMLAAALMVPNCDIVVDMAEPWCVRCTSG